MRGIVHPIRSHDVSRMQPSMNEKVCFGQRYIRWHILPRVSNEIVALFATLVWRAKGHSLWLKVGLDIP